MTHDDLDYTQECSRCSRDVIEIHPMGWTILDFVIPCMEEIVGEGYSRNKFLLCCECMIEFWEWLAPDYTKQPHWLAEKDQLLAQIRDGDT